MSYPYVHSAAKFKKFLQDIQKIGVPDQFQKKNLKALGYTSSNDERFLPALRQLGFIDARGVPQDLWKELRVDLGKSISKALNTGYPDLMHQLPDACQQDAESIKKFFSAHTQAGEEVLNKMVSTFRGLCDLADFSDQSRSEAFEQKFSSNAAGNDQAVTSVQESRSPAININIELQVPSDSTGEVYDKFFEAMKRHLFNDD